MSGKPLVNSEITGKTAAIPGVERHCLQSLFPVVGTDGAIQGVGAIVVDITERKQAEQALQASKLRLSEILDGSAEAIISVDENHEEAGAQCAAGHVDHVV